MTLPRIIAPILVSVLLAASLLSPAAAETYTLLSDTDFAGAARWSLLGVDNSGTSWNENGWASRFSSVADPNGTGAFNAEEYVGLAGVGTKFWGLRNDGASWTIVGFNRFGRPDGTSATLQGVAPGTEAYLGIAGDEVIGELHLFRNNSGWVADHFDSDGTLLASEATSFASATDDFRGWAMNSAGNFYALRAPQGGNPHVIAAFDSSGTPLGNILNLKDTSGMDMPTDRLLEGFAFSGAALPVAGDVMGPFLNGAFSGIARFNSSGVNYNVVPAYPNLQFTEPAAMVADPTGQRFFVAERTGVLSWIPTDESATQKNVMLDISSSTAGGGEVAVLEPRKRLL